MPLAAVLVALAGCVAGQESPGADAAARHAPALDYAVIYRAEFRPDEAVAIAEIEIRQPRHLLRELDFRAPPARYLPLAADGELIETQRGFVWRPPANGGVLRYAFTVERTRGRREPPAYDARMTSDWALLRADHLFPAARTRTLRGAQSRPRLALSGPEGWSFETRYGPVDAAGITLDVLERGFVRPTGWLVAGDLGIRRERIAGRRVAVAAPVGEGFRRNDVLAMLNWNLPHLVELFPEFPDRLLIVGAGDPMWRGGLSGPGSLYLHADRPMLSENGTSTLIHELVHVGSRFASLDDDNWIVEGLAEYYSIELMRRSGTLSEQRFERALAMLERWGRDAPALRARRASGPVMARAAVLMHALDREIQEASGGRHDLDELVRRLQPHQRALTGERLAEAAASLLGRPSTVLDTAFD